MAFVRRGGTSREPSQACWNRPVSQWPPRSPIHMRGASPHRGAFFPRLWYGRRPPLPGRRLGEQGRTWGSHEVRNCTEVACLPHAFRHQVLPRLGDRVTICACAKRKGNPHLVLSPWESPPGELCLSAMARFDRPRVAVESFLTRLRTQTRSHRWRTRPDRVTQAARAHVV